MKTPFTIIVPTWNRAHALRQTLDSVLAQTEKNWHCHVFDDGSTDETPALMEDYKGEVRFHYTRFKENRGGVSMNEIGMRMAVNTDSYWVRLGSDDWFLPRKLELDRIALESGYGACFGPYKNFPWVWDGELNVPSPVRATLLRGEFAASWANIAVRPEVLKEIYARYGSFVDPRLRNMEDYLFNTRLARSSEIVWRAGEDGGDRVIVGATSPEQVPFKYTYDAVYRIGLDGASNAPGLRDWCVADSNLTVILRGEDHMLGHPVNDIPPPVPVIFGGSASSEMPPDRDVSALVQAWYDSEGSPGPEGSPWAPQGKNIGWADYILIGDGALVRDKTVLNLGCFYPEDEQRFGATGRWTSIDFTPRVIERCKVLVPHVDFRVMDIRQLDFLDGTFNVVLDFSSGDHLVEVDFVKMLREVFRVLRPGGHFVCVFTNSVAMAEHFKIWRGMQEEWGRFGYTRGYTCEQMIKLLQGAGFEVGIGANEHIPRSGFVCVKPA